MGFYVYFLTILRYFVPDVLFEIIGYAVKTVGKLF